MNREVRSLRLAEPAEVAGEWLAVAGNTSCPLTLQATRIEAINGFALTGADCLAPLVRGAVQGWRPAPDGIELVGADRLTLLMFADQGDGTGIADVGAAKVVLRRR